MQPDIVRVPEMTSSSAVLMPAQARRQKRSERVVVCITLATVVLWLVEPFVGMGGPGVMAIIPLVLLFGRCTRQRVAERGGQSAVKHCDADARDWHAVSPAGFSASRTFSLCRGTRWAFGPARRRTTTAAHAIRLRDARDAGVLGHGRLVRGLCGVQLAPPRPGVSCMSPALAGHDRGTQIASSLSGLSRYSVEVQNLILNLFMLLVSAFVSHTVSAAILLPITASVRACRSLDGRAVVWLRRVCQVIDPRHIQMAVMMSTLTNSASVGGASGWAHRGWSSAGRARCRCPCRASPTLHAWRWRTRPGAAS